MNIMDYEKLLERFPWIIEKNKNCIISPDVDGILCGLFMSCYFDWKLMGIMMVNSYVSKIIVNPMNVFF